MLEPGTLALIPFPYAESHTHKRRPVLILRSPDGHGDFIAVAITSKGQHSGALAISQVEMASGTLPKPSWIRPDKVYTLNDALVVKVVGQVRGELLQQTADALCRNIGGKS
jgi:mRNA interferase MazF